MLENSTVWIAVGLIIFIALLWKFGVHTMVLNALDRRAEKIASELAEARRLREDAERLLAEFESKRKAAETEAEAIVAAAREDAERMAKEAESKMNDFVARRTKAAELKIAQAEAQAAAEVRAAAADAAAKAAEVVLRERMSGKAGADLLTSSLAEVKAKLN